MTYPGDAVITDQKHIELIAPAKVNLFLDIGNRRPDGYHEAISIMHGLMLHDVLHMGLEPDEGSRLNINLVCQMCEGIPPLDVRSEDNIVGKAIRLLAKAAGRERGEKLSVIIEKRIPAEAGLGGGSSDAAAALVGAACLWRIPADDPCIEQTARSLGADVAFFLHGGCACFTGVGDVFTHELIPLDAPVVLVKPEGGVSTAAAYRTFDDNPVYISENDRALALASRDARDVPLCNNLTAASEVLLPALLEVCAWADKHEEVQDALMSGSGSAVFARCCSTEAAERVVVSARNNGWWAAATRFGPFRAQLVSGGEEYGKIRARRI